MIHLIILRYVLTAYVLACPWLFIYLQQSLYRVSFDDELGNKLILRLQIVSTIAAVCLFLASFEGGREIMR